MSARPIEAQVLEVLRDLSPTRQAEILDFALFLREREQRRQWEELSDEEAHALREEFAAEDLGLAVGHLVDYVTNLEAEDRI